MYLNSAPVNTGDADTALADWLARLEGLQPERIELGLTRTQQVLQQLRLDLTASKVIIVAGTNGKGSVVAYLEAIYRQQGISTLAYTSPHILEYNERIRLDGESVSAASLVAAFERVEQARAEVPLTYFEFGTLAALVLLAEHGPQVALLEVGLGGRLDAVNVVDADVAVITSIGIDHSDWLGDDRDSIAREKAGIMRHDRPVVCGEPDPPPAIAGTARNTGARLYQYGSEYQLTADEGNSVFISQGQPPLPVSGLQQLPPHQQINAATALAAARLMNDVLMDTHYSPLLDIAQLQAGRWLVAAPGRIQKLAERPDIWLDVAHNPQAAQALAQALRHQPATGRTVAVLAMLAGKDATGVAAALDDVIGHWYLASTGGPRGLDVMDLQQLVAKGAHAPVTTLQSVPQALDKARAEAAPQDRIIVLGSFMNAAALLGKALEQV